MRYILFLQFQLISWLGWAQCSFPIPPEIGHKKMEYTTHLQLSQSTCTRIDSSLQAFSALQSLDLSFSRVNTVDEQLRLPKLTELTLSHTPFDPLAIHQLGICFPQLQTLNLAHCRLMYLPTDWRSLSQLEALDLSNNGVTFLPSGLEELRHLRKLNVAGNSLTSFLQVLHRLWNLEYIDVRGNPFLHPREFSASIESRPKLNTLCIDGRLLEQITPAELANWPVQHLVIATPTRAAIALTAYLPKLVSLELINTEQTTVGSAPIYYPEKLRKLIITEGFIHPNFLPAIQIDTLVLHHIYGVQLQSFHPGQRIGYLDATTSQLTTMELNFINELLPHTEVAYERYLFLPTHLQANRARQAITPIAHKTHEVSSEVASVVRVKNTAFFIPAGAFRLPDGTVYSGTVHVDIQVLENPADFAVAGAPMWYRTGGQPALLGSQGMVFLEAKTSDGMVLAPNPNATIEVVMNKRVPNKQHALYSFDSISQHWRSVQANASFVTPANQQRFQRILDSIYQSDRAKRTNVLTNEPAFDIRINEARFQGVSLRLKRHLPRQRPTLGMVFFDRNIHQTKEFSKHTWLLDTLIDEHSLLSLTSIAHSSQLEKRKTSSITHVSVEESERRGRFRVRFYYHDTLISWPVRLRPLGEKYANKLRTDHVAMRLRKANQRDREAEQLALWMQEDHLSESEKQARQERISRASADTSAARSLLEMHFRLRQFGWTQIGGITKTRPTSFLSLAPNFVDQLGKQWPGDGLVRLILFDENTYLSVSTDQLPVYEHAVGLIQLSETFFGLFWIHEDMNPARIPITLLSIENKSAEEISELILHFRTIRP